MLTFFYFSWCAHCLVVTSSIVNAWIDGQWQRGPVRCVKETLQVSKGAESNVCSTVEKHKTKTTEPKRAIDGYYNKTVRKEYLGDFVIGGKNLEDPALEIETYRYLR